jgi:hypothetical protein
MTNDLPPMPNTPSPVPGEPPTMPAAAPAAKRRLSPLAAGLIGLVAGAAIVGGAWAIVGNSNDDAPAADGKGTSAVDALNGKPGEFTLDGSFELTDGAVDDGLGGCEGSGGYEDIAEGASVTVYDAAGAVIATGSLGTSTYELGTCTFDVSVGHVPKGEDFYKVEVSHRGTVQLTADEAESGQLAASLG